MKTRRLTVTDDRACGRLDKWLCGKLPDLSRSRIQSLTKAGNVTVGGAAAKAHQKLAVGMKVVVRIPDPEPINVGPEDISLAVLHEDTEMIVINKPPGMVVHPAPGHASGTLVNALIHHCGDLTGIGGELRPGIVHRLDKDTSGVLVAAKTELAMSELARQFKEREVTKEYLAAVWGELRPSQGRIERPIGRSLADRKKMAVREDRGRLAVTAYETVEVFDKVSVVRVSIETGRTHQIRVHMAHMKHAIVGDRKYGRARSTVLPVVVRRQMLHAQKLVLHHPKSGRRMRFIAPLAADMECLLQGLRDQSGAEA